MWGCTALTEIRLTPTEAHTSIYGTEYSISLREPEPRLLHPCVRWVSSTEQYWILEFPPRLQTVCSWDYTSRNGEAAPKTFLLSVPWTVCCVDVGIGGTVDVSNLAPWAFSIFGRSDRLTDWGDQLFQLPLPNYHEDGTPCWGLPHANIQKELGTINDSYNRALHLVNCFWATEFNAGWYINRIGRELKNLPEPFQGFWDATKGMSSHRYFDAWEQSVSLETWDTLIGWKPVATPRGFLVRWQEPRTLHKALLERLVREGKKDAVQPLS